MKPSRFTSEQIIGFLKQERYATFEMDAQDICLRPTISCPSAQSITACVRLFRAARQVRRRAEE